MLEARPQLFCNGCTCRFFFFIFFCLFITGDEITCVWLSFFVVSGWESSTTEMPWSSVITTTPGSAPRGASGCRSSTPRPAWLRATATSGWKRDTGGQVRHKNDEARHTTLRRPSLVRGISSKYLQQFSVRRLLVEGLFWNIRLMIENDQH